MRLKKVSGDACASPDSCVVKPRYFFFEVFLAAFLAPFLAAFFVAIAILPFRLNIESCNACVAISHLYMCIQISCQEKKKGESPLESLTVELSNSKIKIFISAFSS
jgi:hypothetical protein